MAASTIATLLAQRSGYAHAVPVTMAALVGHPQTLAYVVGLSAAYGVYRFATTRSIRGLLGSAAAGKWR